MILLLFVGLLIKVHTKNEKNEIKKQIKPKVSSLIQKVRCVGCPNSFELVHTLAATKNHPSILKINKESDNDLINLIIIPL